MKQYLWCLIAIFFLIVTGCASVPLDSAMVLSADEVLRETITPTTQNQTEPRAELTAPEEGLLTWEQAMESLATNPGLSEDEMPNLDHTSAIRFRYENSELTITDKEDLEYIVGEVARLLTENSMTSNGGPCSYVLEFLDADGNELACVDDVSPTGLRFDGESYVGDGAKLFEFLNQYVFASVDTEKITSVMLQSLNPEMRFTEITEKEDVTFVVDMLMPLLQKPSGEMNQMEGWMFNVELLDQDGNVVIRVSDISVDSVVYEGFMFWGDYSEIYDYFLQLTK